MSSQERDPLVTIGVFCYNQGDYAADAVANIQRMTYRNVECFLVDDGSKDDSAERIREAAGSLPGAKVIEDGENLGLPNRIQQVVERAAGEWLYWVPVDDIMLPHAVATLVAATSPQIDVVWGDMEVVSEDGQSLGYRRPGETWQGPTARKYVDGGYPFQDLMRSNNFINGPMTLVRREAVLKVGGYPPGIRPEDLNMWLTMGRTSRFKYVPEVIAKYRVVQNSGSRNEPFAMRNQAAMCRHQLELGDVPRSGMARLMAMRWSLHLARERFRPSVSLQEFAEMCGLRKGELAAQLPRAAADPIVRSGTAWLRRKARGVAR